jgi:radical SAM superfamily enzyme YgiQ (UPF0313 family)
MKNIVLINPIYEMEVKRIIDEDHMDVQADATPLGLATIAALTPDKYQVDVWDEFIRGKIEESGGLEKYDMVGITGSSVSILRARQIADFFRKRGVLVAIGGPGVSATPDRFRGHFDVLFIGEGELIWPQFLRDREAGNYRNEYRQIEKPDLSSSPIPKWESMADHMDKYALGSVQTTRGCPFDCEFCDVVYLYGRRLRHKSVESVLEEVRVLERLGISAIYFTDDNFVVDHRYAKKVLKALIPLNNSFAMPIRFVTQGSIDVSRDDELLSLLADANFFEICIGIESPNIESLKEVGKHNNLRGDLVEDVRKIQSYGIAVRGSLICGLDHDGTDIFERQHELIQNSCLPAVNPNLLIAAIGTRLWRRLREENRVVDIFKITDKVTKRFISNVIPKRMSRIELLQGYGDLYKKIYNWENFKERMIGFVSLSFRPPGVRQDEVSVDKLDRLGQMFDLEPEGCKAMKEIFDYTLEKAPYLIGRVKDLVLQFAIHYKSAHELLPKLYHQIELESSGELTYELDNRPVTVPRGFTDSYRSIFPEVFSRVCRKLTDKNRAAEAMVEIFVEFLVHEEGFSRMEDHHLLLLNEIVDSTCVRINSQEDEGAVPADTPFPDAGKLRLHEDILKSVEQELLKLAQAKTERV